MRAKTLDTDVLIVGGGVAGCTSALTAHELGAGVLMVVKGKMEGATSPTTAISTTRPRTACITGRSTKGWGKAPATGRSSAPPPGTCRPGEFAPT